MAEITNLEILEENQRRIDYRISTLQASLQTVTEQMAALAANMTKQFDILQSSLGQRENTEIVLTARDVGGLIESWRMGNSNQERISAVDFESVAADEKKKLGEFKVFEEMPAPLGTTARDDGVDFAICSFGAESAILCLFTLANVKENTVTEQILLDPVNNRTENIWHIFLEGDFEDVWYGYKFDENICPEEGHYFDDSRVLLDPYAKAVISRGEYGVPGPDDNCWSQMVGTYLGVLDKLDHLKEFGVNCIEVMPCQEFNELLNFSYNNSKGKNMLNFWDYCTINCFSPMMIYSFSGITTCGRDIMNEFKTLVREAHKRGIEVIMDVVFNHTTEGNEKGPILSFRGVDNNIYYMVAPEGEFYNYLGCANTFNCNHPVVCQFILDCLRYWITEMHVDGFRFDLASIMSRSSILWDVVHVYGKKIEGDALTTGTPLSSPPLVDMIGNDPILHGVKIIAETWDPGGLYQVGHLPHWGIWPEWNGRYQDNVRQFIKGADGFFGVFIASLCGSAHLYQEGGSKPWNSINIVCAHDGFTLADPVIYNLTNGEENRDEENHNLSWNCGEEREFARIGEAAYKLLLPDNNEIHLVFYVYVLKAYKGTLMGTKLELHPFSYKNKPVPKPQAILEKRQLLQNGVILNQALIQWKVLPIEESSWEAMDDLQTLVPDFDLEDKVSLGEESDDRISEEGRTRLQKRQDQVDSDNHNDTRRRNKPRWLEYYM